MLPHVIRHREAASEVFGLDLGGNPDYVSAAIVVPGRATQLLT